MGSLVGGLSLACTVSPNLKYADLSAAKHADILFAKKEPGMDSDLATYCKREGIPHILFENFSQVLPLVQAIVEGKISKEEALRKGKAY